jgi:3-hydroxyisobutyrate dehydrogenase-like beta-hydroxyacid dehydrogenase
MGRGNRGPDTDRGNDLVAYNRTPEKAQELAAAGARVAASTAEACEDREVVITMVADDAALEEVTLGDEGLRDSLAEGAIHMTMGTHGVATVRALTEAHTVADQVMIAAHAVGRPDVAAAGQIGIIIGGPPDAVARCTPLFEAIGRRTFEAGEEPARRPRSRSRTISCSAARLRRWERGSLWCGNSASRRRCSTRS